MDFSISAITDIGAIRKANEDGYLIRTDQVYRSEGDRSSIRLDWSGEFHAVICDGMGGSLAGVAAMRTILESIDRSLHATSREISIREKVIDALESAHEEVKKLNEDPEMTGSGGFGGLIVGFEKGVVLAGIGGISFLIVRGNEFLRPFRRIEMFQIQWIPKPPAGFPEFPPEEVFSFVDGIGHSSPVSVAVVGWFKPRQGDLVFAYTDGVPEYDDEKLGQVELCGLLQSLEPEELSNTLIQKVYENGANDNTTILTIRVNNVRNTENSASTLAEDFKVIKHQHEKDSPTGKFLSAVIRWFFENGRKEDARSLCLRLPDPRQIEEWLPYLTEP